MIKFKEQKLKIFISDNVKNTLYYYSSKSYRNRIEYGGILLGRVTENQEIYIDIISKPNKFDVSRYLSFIRKKSPSQKIIDKTWDNSNGIINYLGEWHTHPFESNKPSLTDINMIKACVSKNISEINKIVMIIIDSTNKYSLTIASVDFLVTREDIKND